MTGSNKLTKQDFLNTSLRAFFMQNGFNYSNYQGIGYANTLRPALRKLYKDDDDKFYESLEKNIEFYNTNPHFFPFITSMHLVMLENDLPEEEIRGIKMALMGPLAGIGDSLSQFILAPLFSSIAASLAGQGMILGPIFYLIAMNTVLTAIKLTTGMYGYKFGTSIIDKLSEQMASIANAANIVGVTVISALAVQFVKITIPLQFAAGDVVEGTNQSILSVQGMFDRIAPALLPALFTLFIYYLIKVKKWSTYKLVLLTVAIGIIGSWIGILG